MFLLSRLWAKILFDSSALHSFVAASSVDVLGLEVETLDEPLYVSSLLGTRVRVDQICRDCELEILRILLTVDLRVVCEYEDVFPNEMPRLPPHRDVDFVIELHLGTLPISMTSHRMAPVKLQELKVQL